MNSSSWISAFRLRTLPLALSSIGMGGFLAAKVNKFDLLIFALCCLTTLLLQILSNLANDYGDSVHGADNVKRDGPIRMVQAGKIPLMEMKRALYLFALLALMSGLTLLYISFGFTWDFYLFLFLGVLAIIAAITYTAGIKPYGYLGLGDISVLLFFGPLAVAGTFYLQAQYLPLSIFFPALSCGFFASAVLNVNNIRDINSDKLAGKLSIPVRLGRSKAIIYHYFLIISGFATALIYTFLYLDTYWQLLFALILPLLFINARAVTFQKESIKLDPYLKQMAMTTLLFVLLFGIGLLL